MPGLVPGIHAAPLGVKIYRLAPSGDGNSPESSR